MVDPKLISRQLRDTISRSLSDNDTCDNVTVRHLLASHEVADAELSRLTAENASLRLDMEGARKAIEDARQALYDTGYGLSRGPVDARTADGLCGECVAGVKNCEAALALLPAPGEPGKLVEALRVFVELHRAWASTPVEEANVSVLRATARNIAADALCALVPEKNA